MSDQSVTFFRCKSNATFARENPEIGAPDLVTRRCGDPMSNTVCACEAVEYVPRALADQLAQAAIETLEHGLEVRLERALTAYLEGRW